MLSLKEFQDKLKEYIYGQDRAIQQYTTVIYKYLLKSLANKNLKSNFRGSTTCLLIGNSGSGKTYLSKLAGEVFNLPFLEINAKSICQEGWAGKSFLTLLQDQIKTYKEEHKTIVKGGIIFIDEFDKMIIPNQSSMRDDVNFHMQASLLKYIEGMTINSDVGLLDFSKYVFVFAGAFSGLEKREKAQIGFNKTQADEFFLKQALQNFGMLPELCGRLQEIIELKPISKYTYKRILNSENFILKYWKETLEKLDIKLKLNYNKAIKGAEKSNLGVRGLIFEVERTVTSLINKNLDKIKLELLINIQEQLPPIDKTNP